MKAVALACLVLLASCAPAPRPVALPSPAPAPSLSSSYSSSPATPVSAALTGTVTSSTGAPVAGAIVAAVPPFDLDDDDSRPIVTRSDAAGRFRFEGLAAGRHGVTATAPGFTAGYGGVATTGGATPPAAVALRLRGAAGEGVEVRGTVSDEGGAVVAGAQVNAVSMSELESAIYATIAGPDGRYTLTLPADAPYFLVVDAVPHPRTYFQIAAAAQIADAHLEPAPAPRPDDATLAAWLRASAIPLAGVDAGHGSTDLDRLDAVVGDARLVALGEATHGSSEFFRMKRRLIEHLVERLGFTVVAIEAPFSETLAVDDYVVRGVGDPRAVVAKMDTWTWDTEEMVALVRWMREYNADRAHPIKLRFLGIDILTPAAIASALEYLKKVDAAAVPSIETALAPLRLTSADGTYPAATAAVQAATRKGAEDLLARLDAHKAAYVARSSDDAWTLVRQHATVIAQAEASYRDSSLRDPGMADNVRWLLDHPAKGSKMILWAHNAHVAFSPIGFDALGRLLKKAYKTSYLSLGFVFDHGSFQALDATDAAKPPHQPPTIFSVGAPPAGSLDEALGLANLPFFAVDLRAAPPPCAAWLGSRLVTRSVGGVYVSEARMRARRAPARSFDALVYVREVTAAHPNPKLR